MQENINIAVLKKDLIAHQLVDYLRRNQDRLGLDDAIIYHNFPMYRSPDDDTATAKILVVSRVHGIIVFGCSGEANRSVGGLSVSVAELEQVYATLFSKLVKSKRLRKGPTELLVPLHPVLFAPQFSSSIQEYLDGWPGLSVAKDEAEVGLVFAGRAAMADTDLREIFAILEASGAILKPKARKVTPDSSTRGSILSSIETEIANFDGDQRQAALTQLDGPQRIRGLAGSGKTIILTMKAALIHLQDPEAEILYTFYTKSLYDLIKRLITRFYRQFAETDPDWSKIHILHAWGGRRIPGVYYNACLDNGVAPKTYGQDPFSSLCEELVQHPLIQRYDYSIIDEGQDFPGTFLNLCLRLTKNRRIIWGYDECQNILKMTIQDTKKTFGTDANGQYLVDFAKLPSASDIVLRVCYRNPRRVLMYAFALGLGIYNDRIIQMPENKEHWEDWGFSVEQGGMRVGDKMVIGRPEVNSPLIKNKLLDSADTVRLKCFQKFVDECDFVVNCIVEDIRSGLSPEDIMVVSLDDKYARSYFSRLAELLEEKGVHVFNLLTAPQDSTAFSIEGHVTLTTVYRAKGNEAGSVYVVGIDQVFVHKDLLSERNKLFTAMTRSHAWVTLSGCGSESTVSPCLREFEAVSRDYPQFQFIMPDPRELQTIQRDLQNKQRTGLEASRELTDLMKKYGLSKSQLSELVEKSKGT